MTGHTAMSEYKELVKLLNELSFGNSLNAEAFHKAADAIEAQAVRIAELEAKVARLREALMALTEANCTYDGSNIVIPAGSHGNAINTMRLARAALQDTQP